MGSARIGSRVITVDGGGKHSFIHDLLWSIFSSWSTEPQCVFQEAGRFSSSAGFKMSLMLTFSASLVSRRLSALIVVTAMVVVGKTIVLILLNLVSCYRGLRSSGVKCCCSSLYIPHDRWSDRIIAPDFLLADYVNQWGLF